MENTIKTECNRLRGQIKEIGTSIQSAKAEAQFPSAALDGVSDENHREMMANFMLAYRHAEDCRMRLGKVIQALEGGVSVYDQK